MLEHDSTPQLAICRQYCKYLLLYQAVSHISEVSTLSSHPKRVDCLKVNSSHVLHGTQLFVPGAAPNFAPADHAPRSADYAPGSADYSPDPAGDPQVVPAGAALTSVFSHVLASLSTEAQQRFPGPQDNIKIKVPGVESLFSRIGAVYTFAGPLAGDRDFAAFMVDMYGNGPKRKMFRINHSTDIVPKVVCSAMLAQTQNF